MELGHWILTDGLEMDEEAFGFIYVITNKTNGKRYIGKKQRLKTIRRKPLKGKKRIRKDVVETDWKKYTGSCNLLNSEIEKLGKDNFEFEILLWCANKFELSYYEIKIQLMMDVLLSDNYYNGIINCRLGVKNAEKYPPKVFHFLK